MKKVKVGLGVFLAAVLIGSFFFSTVHAQDYPDLSIWLNQWFKASFNSQKLHFSDIGVPPVNGQEVENGTIYLVFISLSQPPYDVDHPPILSGYVYHPNDIGGWGVDDLSLNYVGGNVSNFAGWSEVLPGPYEVSGFTVQIKGAKKKDGTFTGATIKTLGGVSWEIDDVSRERWIGTIKFSGTWVNTNILCSKGKNPTLPPCSHPPFP